MEEYSTREARVAVQGSTSALLERLTQPIRPLLLDGATGTELERAGLQTGLPLWSTHALIEAPSVVRDIHRRYLAAGAEIVTANTFRTQQRTLARAGLGQRDAELTRLAVTLAREAVTEAETDAEARAEAGTSVRHERPALFVAGSQPPLEDCYRPDLVPEDQILEREHVRHAELLAQAGVDLILIETMNTIRESLAAIRAALRTGLPLVVGFVSWERDRILSGQSLREAAARALDAGAAVAGVNCVPPTSLSQALASLAPLGVPLLVSPNLGEPDDQTGFSRAEGITPDDFASGLAPWLEASPETPVALVGGCCGTSPAHIAALARRLADPLATPQAAGGI